jgi:hypothetical protein
VYVTADGIFSSLLGLFILGPAFGRLARIRRVSIPAGRTQRLPGPGRAPCGPRGHAPDPQAELAAALAPCLSTEDATALRRAVGAAAFTGPKFRVVAAASSLVTIRLEACSGVRPTRAVFNSDGQGRGSSGGTVAAKWTAGPGVTSRCPQR